MSREPCPFCSGTGQVSYFKGVSRFLLSVEECPECAGIGHIFKKKPRQKKPKASEKYPKKTDKK